MCQPCSLQSTRAGCLTSWERGVTVGSVRLFPVLSLGGSGMRCPPLSARQLHLRRLGSEGFFVTLPEALPIAVITRFIGWFREFGIPVGGVIVNMVLDREVLGTDAADFVRNRLAVQHRHLRE